MIYTVPTTEDEARELLAALRSRLPQTLTLTTARDTFELVLCDDWAGLPSYQPAGSFLVFTAATGRRYNLKPVADANRCAASVITTATASHRNVTDTVHRGVTNELRNAWAAVTVGAEWVPVLRAAEQVAWLARAWRNLNETLTNMPTVYLANADRYQGAVDRATETVRQHLLILAADTLAGVTGVAAHGLLADWSGTPAELVATAHAIAGTEPEASEPATAVSLRKPVSLRKRTACYCCDRRGIEAVELADGRTVHICRSHAEDADNGLAAFIGLDLPAGEPVQELPASPSPAASTPAEAYRLARGRELLAEIVTGRRVTIVKGKRVPHGVTGTVAGTVATEWGTRVTVTLPDGKAVTTNAANLVAAA